MVNGSPLTGSRMICVALPRRASAASGADTTTVAARTSVAGTVATILRQALAAVIGRPMFAGRSAVSLDELRTLLKAPTYAENRYGWYTRTTTYTSLSFGYQDDFAAAIQTKPAQGQFCHQCGKEANLRRGTRSSGVNVPDPRACDRGTIQNSTVHGRASPAASRCG